MTSTPERSGHVVVELEKELRRSRRLRSVAQRFSGTSTTWQPQCPELPTVDRTLATLKEAALSPGISGAIDGARHAVAIADDLTIDLGFDADFGMGFPIATVFTQSVREGLLLHFGKTDLATAVEHVVVTATSVSAMAAICSAGGTVIFPGIGTVIGGLVGGLLGGLMGQAVNTRHLRHAQETYQRRRQEWMESINLSRETLRCDLQTLTDSMRTDYERSRAVLISGLRSVVVWSYAGSALTTTVRCLTRPFAFTAIGRRLRERAAVAQRGQNRRLINVLRTRLTQVRYQHRTCESRIGVAHIAAVAEQARLVCSMVTELNERFASVKSEMRKLGLA
jgi:hypothetical protein